MYVRDKREIQFGIRHRGMAKPALFQEAEMWYVIQVATGKEETVMEIIEKQLPADTYEKCFFIKRERVWRRDGECIVHLETMFPGYLFLCTAHPGEAYWQLRNVPQFTKLLKQETDVFLSIEPDEQLFLEHLINGDPDNVVRLSEVTLNGEKEIIAAEGPLRHYVDHIVKKKLRLRYVMIETMLFGKKREVLIGIRLQGDESITS